MTRTRRRAPGRLASIASAALLVGLACQVTEQTASAGNGSLCPPEGIPMGEACGSDIHCIMCGCTPLFYEDVECGQTWCGNAWADSGMRDTEWFVIDVPDPDGDGVETLNVTLVSAFPGVCFVLDGEAAFQCQIVLLARGCGDDGRNLEVATATVPAPAEYAVFVGTADCAGNGIFDGFPCGTANEYALTFKCGPVCLADLDGDGVVGITDFLELLAAWGPNQGHPADLDGDGTVGITDFLILLGSWGPCP